jgi:hypothetical protein
MKFRLAVVLLILLLSLVGCAHNSYQPVRPQDYPESKKMFDLSFGWRRVLSENSMILEGYARNERYPLVQDLELRVELIGADGGKKAAQVYFFIPPGLLSGSMSAFSVNLGVLPQKGDRIRFNYRYRAVEGNDESFDWINSFEAPGTLQ